MIFHSDRGVEYSAHDYQDALRAHDVISSMSRPKTLKDYICVESFFRTLQTESYHGLRFECAEHLKATLKWYIESYYNKKRIHSSLGFGAPDEYEKMAA